MMMLRKKRSKKAKQSDSALLLCMNLRRFSSYNTCEILLQQTRDPDQREPTYVKKKTLKY